VCVCVCVCVCLLLQRANITRPAPDRVVASVWLLKDDPQGPLFWNVTVVERPDCGAEEKETLFFFGTWMHVCVCVYLFHLSRAVRVYAYRSF